jgi:hypothetical protein
MLGDPPIRTAQMTCVSRFSAERSPVPILWSVVAKRLLVRFNKGRLYTHDYANGLAALIT